MYLLKNDIEQFEAYLQEFEECERGDGYDDPAEGSSVEYFFDRPHLLLPLGFDETRPLVEPGCEYWLEKHYDRRWLDRATAEAEALGVRYGLSEVTFELGIETIFRNSAQGAWYWLLGLERGHLLFRGPRNSGATFSISDLLIKLRKLVESPDYVPKTLWLPRIWTPEFQDHDRQKVSDDVASLLSSLQDEKIQLSEIKPVVFEELVAELLRSKGMEVYVTKRTRDGGRDIIARMESTLGDPLTIAVEVKQKPVVGTDDLFKTLKANENFPAIMIATAGRFSAGVIKQKAAESNQLRLMLKDGVALSQWVESYIRPEYSHKKRINKDTSR